MNIINYIAAHPRIFFWGCIGIYCLYMGIRQFVANKYKIRIWLRKHNIGKKGKF